VKALHPLRAVQARGLLALGRASLFALLVALCWPCSWSSLSPSSASAQENVVVYARVVADKAALRTGPGASFRIVRVADQGETFPVRERAPRGFWLRVELPDGSLAFVQGDAVYTHEVGDSAHRNGLLAKVFAPAPLPGAHGEVSFSLGTLSGAGFIALRPDWLLAPSFGLEANLGAAVSSSGRLFLGGIGGIVNLFPTWPVVPFAVAGGGGVYATPNADSFVLGEGSRSMLYAGGGLRFGFRYRLILRVEGRGYAFFDANGALAQQEISGGLSAFF
jgi:hypothetical protein